MDVLVAGAGVVGMACARALQRGGFTVAVADPEPPGSGCSSGNAGIVAADHVLPLARPEVLRRLPAMLLGRRSPLSLKLTRVPRLMPWIIDFANACEDSRVRRGILATAALTSVALAAWQDELEASGGRHLLHCRGMLAVYRSEAAFQRDAGERSQQQHLGVTWEVLKGEALHQREPGLSRSLRLGVYYPAVAHVADPRALVDCLVSAFVREGGRLLTGEIRGPVSQPHQVVSRIGGRRMRSRYLVLAAGLGSADLAAGLGVRMPLAAEMGYHVTYPGAESLLGTPVAAAEEGFIVTPMIGHLRAAGTVEFAAREAPPDWRRARLLAARASRLFEVPLPLPSGRWRGARPTLPDYLPAIGPLPAHPRVMAAFGHQHIGLTTAAVTARVVTALVRGERPPLDTAPYDPGRFTSPRV